MSTHTAASQEYERVLIDIVRLLPPKRVEQLVDFARFLEAQILTEALTKEEEIAEVEADNARWDALLDTDEAQALLEKLADEAFEEYQAGKAKPMTVDDEGRIVPG
jgi:hypothetical protein